MVGEQTVGPVQKTSTSSREPVARAPRGTGSGGCRRTQWARARAERRGRHASRRASGATTSARPGRPRGPGRVGMSSSAEHDPVDAGIEQRRELGEQRRAVRRGPVVDVEARGDREAEPGRRRARTTSARSAELASSAAVVRIPPRVAVLGVRLRCVHVRVHPARGEELDGREPRVVRPRRPVEALDHAAHGERTRHDGRLRPPAGPGSVGGPGMPETGRRSGRLADLLAAHAGTQPDTGRGPRRRGGWRAPVGDDVRRAERLGEPAGARVRGARRAARRAHGVVRTELARGARHASTRPARRG